MDATTVAVDLAKDVIEVAVSSGRTLRRDRLSRKGFARFLSQQGASTIVMEACSGAHFWARRAQEAGHAVKLLPAQYVRPYRRRNKTDRADCSALLEAARNPACGFMKARTIESTNRPDIRLHRLLASIRCPLQPCLREESIYALLDPMCFAP